MINTRKLIFNLLLFGILGWRLVDNGIIVNTGDFWLIMIIAGATYLNGDI